MPSRPRSALRAAPDAPLRAIGLVRVSKVGTRGDDLLSPDLQRTAITTYAGTRGMTVVEWVEALDESGSQSRSPWWRRLEQVITKVEAGDVQAVLVWKYSRAARDRRRWAVALDRIEVAGGVLESATEQLDTTTSTGRLARGMLAELAAWEAEVRAEQWAEVHRNRSARGLPISGGARLGYRLTEQRTYQPDPVVAPIVAELYRRYLAGTGVAALTEWLHDRGVTSAKTGRPWSVRGLRLAMDAGFPAGLLHSGGYPDPRTGKRVPDRWEPGAHPPIIDAVTWQRYQRERRMRPGFGLPAERRVAEPRTPYSAVTRCSGCGHAMRSRRAGGSMRAAWGARPYALQCGTRGCPDPAFVTIAKVETAVLDWLAPHATDLDTHAALAVAEQAERSTAKADRTRLGREQLRVEQRLLDAARSHSSGLYDDPTYATIRDELAGQRGRLREAADRLTAVAEHPGTDPAVLRELLGQWHTLSTARRREALRDLRITVTVGKDAALQGRREQSQVTVTSGATTP